MSGNYNNNRGSYRGNNKGGYKGGGKKDFKADPIKQYLTVRGTSCAYAKDLCVAGKIKLEDIQEWTDRFTVLQYGRLKVDDKVTTEVMRIGTRLMEKINARNANKTPFEKLNEEHPVDQDDQIQDDSKPSDGDAEFDIARERELYEQERAEEEAERKALAEGGTSDPMDTGMPGDKSEPENPKGYYYNENTQMYHCEGCPRSYKTEGGAMKHVADKHTTGGDYGDQK
jgi:hypothetical protein